MAKEKSEADARLFVPRNAYRLGRYDRAFINYELKDAPKGPVRFEILGADGKVVRSLTSAGHPGINRVVWDMHYDGPHVVELRTVPEQDPHIWEEERFKGKDVRGITHWGMPVEQAGPLAAPGKYTVKMTVGDQSFQQPLEVLIDPHSAGTQQSIEATLKMQLRIREDVTKVADMINRIEWMRKQLEGLRAMYAADPHDAEMLKAVKDTDQKMQDVEYQLVSKDLVASDDKIYSSAYKVYFNLLWLNGEVGQGAGDVAGSGDYGPTDTSVGLLKQIEDDMNKAEASYKELMATTVPAFNRVLASKGGIPLATTAPAKSGAE
jgi:hypothetical protein